MKKVCAKGMLTRSHCTTIPEFCTGRSQEVSSLNLTQPHPKKDAFACIKIHMMFVTICPMTMDDISERHFIETGHAVHPILEIDNSMPILMP